MWGTLYFAILGPTITVAITFGFTLVVGAALVVFLITKRFALLLYPFFVMILWNPISMQWSLGGFAASGVLMTWSILAPVCALMFQNIRTAVWWFLAYLALLALSLLVDDRIQHWAVSTSHATSMLFFGMNIIGPSVALFLSMMYFVNAFQREHARSEGLLLNILPGTIAERLKAGEESIADGYADVTILFADLVDFTPLTTRKTPQELVTLLNTVFSAFDRLTQRHGLEKIKTIGDAYMVVGGIAGATRPDSAAAVAEMALDMRAEMERLANRARGAARPAHRHRDRAGGRRRHRHPEIRIRRLGRRGQHGESHGVPWREESHSADGKRLSPAEGRLCLRGTRDDHRQRKNGHEDLLSCRSAGFTS